MSTSVLRKPKLSITELHRQYATLTHPHKNKLAHVMVNHSPAFRMAVFSWLLITAVSTSSTKCLKKFAKDAASGHDMKLLMLV